MKVSIFLSPGEEAVGLTSLGRGPGESRATLRARVLPGQQFLGWTYDELRALGNGTHDIEPKPGWKAVAPAATA